MTKPTLTHEYDGPGSRWKNLLDGTYLNVTPPATYQPLYGINVPEGGGERGIANRLVWFGRVPIARIFYTDGSNPVWGAKDEVNCAPEKRAHVSFKPSASMASIAAGAIDSAMNSYYNSLPAGWELVSTLWHEPNGEIGTNFSFADFKAATIHLSQLAAAHPKAAQIHPSPLFSAPKAKGGPAWSNSWMMTFEEMDNPNAIWTWDSYGGLSGNQTGTYPGVELALDPGYAQLDSHGWTFEDGHWGIGEFGVARRDADTNGTVEAQWLIDYAAYCAAFPAKPFHVMAFDGSGVSDFDTQAPRDAWKSVVATSR